MEGLQRSAVSFRRQGSSGLVWDDRFLSGELKKLNNEQDKENQQQKEVSSSNNNDDDDDKEIGIGSISTVQRSRSINGGGHRTRRVASPPHEIDPPSPKLSACGFCGAFGKTGDNKGQRSKSRNKKNHHRRSR